MQIKDDWTRKILPVAGDSKARSDYGGMPVTLPRESDGKMRRDGSGAAWFLQPGDQNHPVDERGRVHGAPGFSTIAALPRAAKNRVECRNTTEQIRCRRSLAKDDRLRWPDKRPHIAARSVDCFFFCFSPIRQCAASGRNVHLTINQLFHSHFSHISATGDGRAVCKFIGGGGVVPHHSRRGEIGSAGPNPLPMPSAA